MAAHRAINQHFCGKSKKFKSPLLIIIRGFAHLPSHGTKGNKFILISNVVDNLKMTVIEQALLVAPKVTQIGHNERYKV